MASNWCGESLANTRPFVVRDEYGAFDQVTSSQKFSPPLPSFQLLTHSFLQLLWKNKTSNKH